MKRYNNEEFYNIINDILLNKEFDELKKIDHHGITRHEHCLRVAYYTYIVTKTMHLNYKEATIAALLHDFFTDEVKEKNGFMRLIKHPSIALLNAKKYYHLTPLQEDIIKTHMFPVTILPPKYLESWLVDIIDDFSAIYEKTKSTKNELSTAITFLFIVFIQFFK